MIKITYPDKKPRVQTVEGREVIFCMIRKRWLSITPEEWVRQNFLLYLTETLKYPASLIAVEKQIIVGEMKKRFDIIVFKNAAPFIIIECKEMNVPLAESTVLQALNYNSNVQAEFLVITNGIFCAGFQREAERFKSINSIPPAKSLN